MMSARDHRALSERVEAPAYAPAGISVLPLELMASILRYLTRHGLRTAASVSRGFRAAARVAGLCLGCRISWRLHKPSFRKLDSLLELVAHTLRHGWHVRLDFACRLSQDNSEFPVSQEAEEKISAVIASMVTLMPYLVHLRVVLPSAYGQELDQVLLLPAPHLRTFELQRHGQGPSTGAIPSMLFAGSAPVLHDVALHSVVLPNERIPAFALVRKLRLAYEGLFPPTELARCFPSLRNLHLHYTLHSAALSLDCARRTLAGLHLDELTVGESWHPQMAVLDEALPLRGIRLVRQHADSVYDLGESLWRTDTGPLSVRIRAAPKPPGDIEVLVVPHRAAWRRAFLLDEWDDIGRGVPCMSPPFPAHMAYLRLNGEFCEDFLHEPATYAALQRIRIDLHGESLLPPRSRHGHPRVACPALEEVTLCAINRTQTVDLFDVLRLGFALGQVDRAADARARLVLIGVDFAGSFAPSLLDSAFRSVEQCPLSASGTAVDDAGLWDI